MDTNRLLPPRAARQRRSTPGRLLGLLCLAALAGTGLWGWLSLTGRAAGGPLRQVLAATQPEPLTVLVLGEQQGGGEAPLTDSMMLVSLDPKGDAAGLLSIPRDLWVSIPGHGTGRINEAFEDGGPQLAERVVAQVTGIRPDYYVLLDYAGFQRLIDDVGGVTVDVPRALHDPTFPAPDMRHYAPLDIPAGTVHMDGRLALAYVRERHDDPLGDLGRAARQQQVLIALKDQVLRPGSLTQVPRLVRDLRTAVQTDLPLDEAPLYASFAAQLPPDHIRHDVLQWSNGAVTSWTTPAGAEVLLPHPQAIARIVAQVFPQLAGPPGGARG